VSNIFDQFAQDSPQHETTEIPQGIVTQELESDPAKPTPGTPADLKLALQELLRYGYLEEANRNDMFRRIIVHAAAMELALEPLGLSLRIDSHRGVAFVVLGQNPQNITPTSEDEEWSHPLVRKQRLTLEQSLLLAILRQQFAIHEQEYGVGQALAKIAVDELLPTFMTYVGDSGSDAKNENRLLQLLEQLKTHGIVSEVDKKQEVTIRPLIAHLANPESLAALLRIIKEKQNSTIINNESAHEGDE
jgi:hypothetical protein